MLTHSPGLFIELSGQDRFFFIVPISGLETETKGSSLVQGRAELKAEPRERGSLDFCPGAVMNLFCHPVL